ncbi:MAG TPA: hypothetical protein VGF48_08225 [Thermoanaerobaculia bacterium]
MRFVQAFWIASRRTSISERDEFVVRPCFAIYSNGALYVAARGKGVASGGALRIKGTRPTAPALHSVSHFVLPKIAQFTDRSGLPIRFACVRKVIKIAPRITKKLVGATTYIRRRCLENVIEGSSNLSDNIISTIGGSVRLLGRMVGMWCRSRAQTGVLGFFHSTPGDMQP